MWMIGNGSEASGNHQGTRHAYNWLSRAEDWVHVGQPLKTSTGWAMHAYVCECVCV